MSNTNHESETPPAQTTNGTAGSTSLSGRASRTGGYRGGTNNRGGITTVTTGTEEIKVLLL